MNDCFVDNGDGMLYAYKQCWYRDTNEVPLIINWLNRCVYEMTVLNWDLKLDVKQGYESLSLKD